MICIIACLALPIFTVTTLSNLLDLEVGPSYDTVHTSRDFQDRLQDKDENDIFMAISHLENMKVNFLALDFDLTIIDEHTGGRWEGQVTELVAHVRPVFKDLLPVAMARNFFIAIVTFSSQESLISEVMTMTFPKFHREIPVHGGMKKPKKGKQTHMELATSDLERRHERKISKESTVLIDDDERNIRIAHKNGYRAILFDPDNPMQLLHDLKVLV